MSVFKQKSMNFAIRTVFINTIVGLALYSYLYYSETGNYLVIYENLTQLFSVIVGINIVGFSLFFINKWIGKKIFWKKNFALRFITGIIANFTFSILFILSLSLIYIHLFLGTNLEAINQNYPDIISRVVILSFFFVFIYVIIDFSIFSYNQYSVVQLESIKLITQQIELQYEALKTQLSPHYLFNSLNTISSLIYKSPNLTEQFIRKLAATYKYILQSNDSKLICLSDELDFINDYKFLLGVRFGSAIQIQFDIENKYLSFLVPPLSLQILIENAVKHNVFDDDDKLIIDVKTHGGILEIQNNILEKPANSTSFNIGLTNIKNRFAFFTDSRIKVERNNNFTVQIPLLNPKKIEYTKTKNTKKLANNLYVID